MSRNSKIAVLYQACEPPIVDGERKSKKPGGYQDSGADIAFALKQKGYDLITPDPNPDPQVHQGWCYPDTESGILNAIHQGATLLWANTVLFESHPLQTSSALNTYAAELRVVGQPPHLVQKFDDKQFVNDLLRAKGTFTTPKSWLVGAESNILNLSDFSYPVVGKPVRGRGSHGVKVCRDLNELQSHISFLLKEGSRVILEEFLAGQEATVTVMPPNDGGNVYSSLPIVVRYNHEDGIAPYNGVVAVTANSRVPSLEEMNSESSYADICRECEDIAKLLRVTAPIRIDVRRFRDEPNSRFAAFDVNMKPNMTGPGRPGREDQASLTAMAAGGLGWDYATLLTKILASAKSLQYLRGISL